MSNIEKYRHADSPQVADLTWEVLAARGIEAGDCMAVWDAVKTMSLIAEDLLNECASMTLEYIAEGDLESAQYCQKRYSMYVSWARRDVQELVKFLVRRDFHFPEDEE